MQSSTAGCRLNRSASAALIAGLLVACLLNQLLPAEAQSSSFLQPAGQGQPPPAPLNPPPAPDSTNPSTPGITAAGSGISSGLAGILAGSTSPPPPTPIQSNLSALLGSPPTPGSLLQPPGLGDSPPPPATSIPALVNASTPGTPGITSNATSNATASSEGLHPLMCLPTASLHLLVLGMNSFVSIASLPSAGFLATRTPDRPDSA